MAPLAAVKAPCLWNEEVRVGKKVGGSVDPTGASPQALVDIWQKNMLPLLSGIAKFT